MSDDETCSHWSLAGLETLSLEDLGAWWRCTACGEIVLIRERPAPGVGESLLPDAPIMDFYGPSEWGEVVPAPTVSDEMVERAAKGMMREFMVNDTDEDDYRRWARAALVAALTPEEQ